MIEWNYQRKEPKKHYNVYVHYVTDTGSEWQEPAGDTWAYSKEQAERNVSYRCGDNGDRSLSFPGYSCFYEAKEVDI